MLKCYLVLCAEGNKMHKVSVIAASMAKAYKAAEKKLLEDKHVKVTAINADVVSEI